MKKNIIFTLSTLLLAQNLWASAICSKGRSQVILNDNYTMEVSGLDSKGIKKGSYTCEVIGIGPGFLSIQRKIRCEKQKDPRTIVMGWMIEGLDKFGNQAASVALYYQDLKVFEAGCGKK